MKGRPGNPSEGRRRGRTPQEVDDADVINKLKENPWQHDMELINVLNGPDRHAAKNMDPKKLLDALEGNFDQGKVVLKLPGIVKDPAAEALKKHPLNVDQQKYLESNLRRFKKKSKSDKKKDMGVDEAVDSSNPVFFRAVGDLPETKQRALLLTLSKISKSLEFGGLSTDEDAATVTSTAKSTHSLEKVQRGGGGGDDDVSTMSQLSNPSYSVRSVASHNTGTSSYATNTQYGKSAAGADDSKVTAVLHRIGQGIHLNPESEYKYEAATSRVQKKGALGTDLIAPTEVITIMARDFHVKISTSDIECLMRKFDTDGLGLASLGAMLGSAKLAYGKKVFRSQMADLDAHQQEARRELAEKRAEYREKLGGRSLDGSMTEGSIKRDAMKNVIEKLAQAAYVSMRSKSLRSLNIIRTRVSSKEYRELLKDLNVDLLPREITMLERRYYVASTGTIDTSAFKQEYLALGKDIVRERMRAEALQSFLRTLAKNKAEPAPELDEVSATGGQGPAAGDTLDEKEADLALNASIANNDVKPVASSHFSIELAEEWIADPLSSPSKRKKKAPTSSSSTMSEVDSALASDGSVKAAMVAGLLADDEANVSQRSLTRELVESGGANESAGDDMSSVGMSSLTSRSDLTGAAPGIPKSAAALDRQNKRDKFYAAEEKLKPKNKGQALAGMGGAKGSELNSSAGSVAGSVQTRVSGSTGMFTMASDKTHSYRPQADLDLGRDNPNSSAFEEQTGSLEIPYELDLTAAQLTAHDDATINSEATGTGSVVTINEIDSVRSVHGARPTTKEQKRAIEAQRAAERELRKLQEEARMKQEVEDEEQKARAAAAARIAAAEKAEQEKREKDARAEVQRQEAEKRAAERAAEAQIAARLAREAALAQKTAAARDAALKAAREQAAAMVVAKEVAEKAAAEREEAAQKAARPVTRENKPPSSPPPKSRPTTKEQPRSSTAQKTAAARDAALKAAREQAAAMGEQRPVRTSPIVGPEAAAAEFQSITPPPPNATAAQSSSPVQPQPPISPTAASPRSTRPPSAALFTATALGADESYRCVDLAAQIATVDTLEEVHQVDYAALSEAYFFMGEMRLNQGQPLDALASLERSFRLREFSDPYVVVRRLKQLSQLSAALQGMQAKTDKLCAELIDASDRHFGKEGTEYARSCFFVAEVKTGVGDLPAAAELLQTALAVFSENLGDEHKETQATQAALKHVQASEEDEEVGSYDSAEGVGAGEPPEEEFDLHGEAWAVYVTTSSDGQRHPYYLAYLGGHEHSQWEDPRESGIVGLDPSAAAGEEEKDGYDLGIHTIGLPLSGRRQHHRNEDTSVLMESTDGRTWEQRRLQDEIAFSLGDAKQIEDDDDVLNVSLADAARPDSAQVFAFKNARKL